MYLEEQKKLESNYSADIIHISFQILGQVHLVWMQCECTGTQGFHAEVKENASKQYANNSTYVSIYFWDTRLHLASR